MAATLKRLLASNATANGLLLVTCAVVLWSSLPNRFSVLTAGAAEGVWPTNTPLPVALPQRTERQSRTLVLFVNSGCHYCTEEMPFYRELQKLATERGVQLCAVSMEDEAQLREYLTTSGLAHFALLSRTTVTGLTATPTILLVDANGLVRQSWRGVLSDTQKERVKRLL